MSQKTRPTVAAVDKMQQFSLLLHFYCCQNFLTNQRSPKSTTSVLNLSTKYFIATLLDNSQTDRLNERKLIYLLSAGEYTRANECTIKYARYDL